MADLLLMLLVAGAWLYAIAKIVALSLEGSIVSVRDRVRVLRSDEHRISRRPRRRLRQEERRARIERFMDGGA